MVGGLYARAQGEPEAVWQAIYDHYKPESMEDAIPRNRDRRRSSRWPISSTRCAAASRVGLIPTGSRDPFALRRAAQGVVRILVEGKLRSAALDADRRQRRSCATSSQDRVRYYFRDIRGFEYDEVNAVHGRRLEQPGRPRSAPGARAEPARRRRISSRSPPASNASQHSASRRNSTASRAERRRSAARSRARSAISTTSSAASPGQPIENVDLAPAAQGRSVLRQSAGERAGRALSGRTG